MKIPLTELHPRLWSYDYEPKQYLEIDCPVCKSHRFNLPVHTQGPCNTGLYRWGIKGTLPNITITPSINMGGSCSWHGFIIEGIVEF